MGPNAWSTIGSGLSNFAQLLQQENDRRLKREREQDELDRLAAERAEKKAAAEAAAQKRADFDSEFTELNTRGVRRSGARLVPNINPNNPFDNLRVDNTEEERYEPATAADYKALMSKYGMTGSKDFSNFFGTLDKEQTQKLNDQKQTYAEKSGDRNYNLDVDKFGETKGHNRRTEAIGQQNANANMIRAKAAAVKATAPPKTNAAETKAAKQAIDDKFIYEWAKAHPTWSKGNSARLAAEFRGYKNKNSIYGDWFGKLYNAATKGIQTDYEAQIQSIIDKYERHNDNNNEIPTTF